MEMRFSIFLDCQSTVYCDLITGRYLPSRQVYSIILWFCEIWFLAPFWSRRFPPLSWLAQDRNHVPDEMDWPATMSTAFVFNWQIGAASSFMSLLWGRVCERHLFVEMERFPRLTPKYKKKGEGSAERENGGRFECHLRGTRKYERHVTLPHFFPPSINIFFLLKKKRKLFYCFDLVM